MPSSRSKHRAPGPAKRTTTAKKSSQRDWSGKLIRRSPKTSELVSLEIIRDIVRQKLGPEDRLPIEAEMLVHYGVSRSSLREALRLLEVQGLVEIRPGPGAPIVVGRVHPANLARTITLYLHLQGVTYNELLDAWMLSEPFLAELAAKNPDRERTRKLMTPFLEPGKGNHHSHWELSSGPEFHEAIAELTGNRVMKLSLRPVAAIVREHIFSSVQREHLDDYVVDEHRGIAQAIITGDPDLAKRLMQEHIRHLTKHYRAYWPKMVGEKIRLR